jgi:hypothetical protein
MKKVIIPIVFALSISASYAQFNLGDLEKTVDKAKDAYNKATTTTQGKGNSSLGASLSNDDVVKGLKEALSIGSNNAGGIVSQLDGFYKNANIKIPLPADVQMVSQTLRDYGLGKQMDKAELTMNRAAEDAAKQAAPIFVAAISKMSITDGLNILRGDNNAATQFLKNTTSMELTSKLQPFIQQALQKYAVTQYWKPVVTAYNKIPLVNKKDPNLDNYVTQKALEGIFYMVSQEELKIRKDPAARVSDILKKVFGS